MTGHHHRIHRTLVVLLTLAVLARPASGQVDVPSSSSPRWALFITTGSMMPTGELHHALRSAPLTAAQVLWLPRPRVAVVGTLGWARSRDLVTVGAPKVDAITADLGAELRSEARDLGAWGRIGGFVGSGIGMRRYDSRAVDTDASHHVATYVAVGTDLTVRRVGLRIELRDYASGFAPLTGAGERTIGNDVVVMTSLRLHRRRTAAQ
jgi:hypothetical protein